VLVSFVAQDGSEGGNQVKSTSCNQGMGMPALLSSDDTHYWRSSDLFFFFFFYISMKYLDHKLSALIIAG
jgi:hypothetical protein